MKNIIFQHFGTNFHHQRAPDPKDVGTIETGSVRCFFWHLAKSNQTNSYRDTRSSGYSMPFLLAPAEGWGALWAPCYVAYGPIAREALWALCSYNSMKI